MTDHSTQRADRPIRSIREVYEEQILEEQQQLTSDDTDRRAPFAD